MALKTLVKINHVNNLSDARYCAGMGVDLIGFDLRPGSPHFVAPKQANDIGGWLAGVRVVGEVGSEPAPNLDEYTLHLLQVESEALLEALSHKGLPFLFHLPLPNLAALQAAGAQMAALQGRVEAFVLTGPLALDAQSLPLLAQYAAQYPLLLGFGINGQNVGETLERLPLQGIALDGENEIRPGLKDFDALAQVLEALELDEDVEY